jgi:hypothetical protein
MISSKALLTITLFRAAAFAQSAPIIVPPGTQLPVSSPTKLPMRVGAPIRAELLYPVYADDQLVLPAKTIVTGLIVSLSPDHRRRVNGRLHFDFTPFHTPVVRFDTVVLPSGVRVPIVTDTATDGAPVYKLVAPLPRKGGFVRQRVEDLLQAGKDRLKVITGPDKGDRFMQFVYSQLPYHPESIAKETAWTVETVKPATFAATTNAEAAVLPPPVTEEFPTWILQAYLDTPISSETSKVGQAIQATVAKPILNEDGSIEIPQGSVLTGSVTSARPSRKFSRAGDLRFTFRELKRPGEEAQIVRVALKGVNSSSAAQLAMDSEGNVKPKPQDKLLVPLILLDLAARPLHQEHGQEHMLGKNAVASNSLGAIGFIIGTAAGQPNIAAGIGFYGAALSIYQRIFAKGKEVAFAKDTRVVLQTSATRGKAMKAGTARHI